MIRLPLVDFEKKIDLLLTTKIGVATWYNPGNDSWRPKSYQHLNPLTCDSGAGIQSWIIYIQSCGLCKSLQILKGQYTFGNDVVK